MRKHGLTECNYTIENSKKGIREDVKFSMPDKLERGMAYCKEPAWGTRVEAGKPTVWKNLTAEKELHIVKSGAGYVVDTAPGCYPKMTSDPGAAGRFNKGTAAAIATSLALIGLDAELVRLRIAKLNS
jgi:hypothetical protein